jgi:hypothetical protein
MPQSPDPSLKEYSHEEIYRLPLFFAALLAALSAVLTRDDQNHYVLSYEGYFNGTKSTKTLPPANSLDALSSVMSESGDFVQDDIRQVRAQAALIPAVRLNRGALDEIKVILTNFYTSPNADTYNVLCETFCTPL